MMPALLTRWSIRPWAATTASATSWARTASETSARWMSARPPAPTMPPGDGLELVLLDVDEDDRRSLGREVDGDGFADALGGAGHDRNAAFEPFHAAAPLRACS